MIKKILNYVKDKVENHNKLEEEMKDENIEVSASSSKRYYFIEEVNEKEIKLIVKNENNEIIAEKNIFLWNSFSKPADFN